MHSIKYQVCKGITLYGFLSDNHERTVEYCSRCCYNSEADIKPKSWIKYIQARIKSTHESVIEHNCLTFMLVGTSQTILTKWEKLFYEGNNLIKATRGKRNSEHYLILSGNIHMYRDLLKNIENDDDYTLIYSLFDSLTHVQGDNYHIYLEALAIPENKSIHEYESNIAVHHTPSKPVKLLDIPTEDPGIFVSIINMDNPLKTSKVLTNPDHIQIVSDNILYFGSITFKIKNPRIISQQDSRHRVQGMSQKSQRYVDSSDGYEYYVPEQVDADQEYTFKIGNKEIVLSYDEYMQLAGKMYEALRADGVKKETARFALTNATYTEYCLTKPFYTLGHYFHERTAPAAQYEIRVGAIEVKKYADDFTVKRFKKTNLFD